MLYVASPVAWHPHFEADGSIDGDDRAHLLHIYGGNSLEAGGGTGSGGATPKRKRKPITRAQREERELMEILTIAASCMN